MSERHDKTLADVWKKKLQDNPILAAVIILAIAVAGIAGFASNVQTILGIWGKKDEPVQSRREGGAVELLIGSGTVYQFLVAAHLLPKEDKFLAIRMADAGSDVGARFLGETTFARDSSGAGAQLGMMAMSSRPLTPENFGGQPDDGIYFSIVIGHHHPWISIKDVGRGLFQAIFGAAKSYQPGISIVPITVAAPVLCRPPSPDITIWMNSAGSGTYDQFSRLLGQVCSSRRDFDWANEVKSQARTYVGRGYEAFAGAPGPWIEAGSDMLNSEIQADGVTKTLSDYPNIRVFYLSSDAQNSKPVVWDLFIYGKANREKGNKYRLARTDLALVKSLLTNSLIEKVKVANMLVEPITNDELAHQQETLHVNWSNSGEEGYFYASKYEPIVEAWKPHR